MQQSLFKTREEEWLVSGTTGNATDLVAVYNNVGANCHTLQVAGGNLQLTENRLDLDINRGCGNCHKGQGT